MTVTQHSETERVRRCEFVRETKAALQQGETIEQRAKRREDKADDWARWFRQKMDKNGCTDPAELLPDAFAKLEQAIDDCIAVAIAEMKATLRGALK
jgi:hypothetical protein